MNLKLQILLARERAKRSGFHHLAASFEVLMRQELHHEACGVLILPKRPGVFGDVHPLDQLKATRPAFPSATAIE